MYKVFICDKPLILTSEEIQPDDSYTTVIPFSNTQSINQAITLLEQENSTIKKVILKHPDTDLLHRNFFAHFNVIHAAGGLVRNELSQLLCIYRNNRWDLPKGKCEKGEEWQETALREVEEECGISGLQLSGKQVDSCHIYRIDGDTLLKITHWYPMLYNGNEQFKPQTEEGITDAQWFSKFEMKTFLNNTYASLKDLLTRTKMPE